MGKKTLRPYEALYPVPVVLVTCAEADGRAPNIITIAWAGVICSSPPAVSVSIRPSRHSYGLIERSREFVINIPDESRIAEVDYCGIVSGKNTDKFKKTGFTALPAREVKAPLIKECPVNIECRVKNIIELGAHHLFAAEIINVNADDSILNNFGAIDYSKTRPIVYNQGEYWSLNKRIGQFGMSGKIPSKRYK